MAPPAVVSPVLLTDPGYLFGAPLGTAEPTNTVSGSVFTDAWAAAWLPLGATEEGSEFSYSIEVEPIVVAEFFDPIKYSTTARAGKIGFNLASWTLHNVKRAMNGGMGAITPTSGTGATTLAKFEPPDPGAEVRIMIGWESLDNTVRIIMRQCISAAEIAAAFKKPPDIALLPCEFNFEVPSAAKPFTVYSAGVTRLG